MCKNFVPFESDKVVDHSLADSSPGGEASVDTGQAWPPERPFERMDASVETLVHSVREPG